MKFLTNLAIFAAITSYIFSVNVYARSGSDHHARNADAAHSADAHGTDGSHGRKGDDDPYPRACVDFSGAWQSDDGLTYGIQQKRCSQLRLEQGGGPKDSETGKVAWIIPDGQFRSISGPAWSGKIRYSWNAAANTIETYQLICYGEYWEEDVTQLENVNESMMLESTYRTIHIKGQEAKKEYSQKVFRRAEQQNAKEKRN